MKNHLTKLSRREKVIISIAALVFLALLFNRMVVRQMAMRMHRLNKDIAYQQARLKRSLFVVSREKLISEEYQRQIRDIIQRYSDKEEKARLNSEIVQLAKKTGIFLADIKASNVEESSPYKKLTVEIEVEAKMPFLADFIYQLEKSPYLLRLEEIYLVPKRKNPDILNARMVISELLIIPKEVLANIADD